MLRPALLAAATLLAFGGAPAAHAERVADVPLPYVGASPGRTLAGPGLTDGAVAWAEHTRGSWTVLRRARDGSRQVVARPPTPAGGWVEHELELQAAGGVIGWEERAYNVESAKYQEYRKLLDRVAVARAGERPLTVAGCDAGPAACEPSCPSAESYAGAFAWALASRTVTEVQRCGDPVARIRDLADPAMAPRTASTSRPPSPFSAEYAPEPVRAAGGLVAVRRGDAIAVLDATTLGARSAVAVPPGLQHWDLDEDGSLAFVTGGGALLWAPPGATDARLVREGLRPTAIRLRGGRVAGVLASGRRTALAVVDVRTGAVRTVARYRGATMAGDWIGTDTGRVTGLDFDGETVAWSWTRCDRVRVERAVPGDGAVAAPRAIDCGVPRLVAPRPALTRGGVLVMHLHCARGCGVRLTVAGRRLHRTLPPRPGAQRLAVRIDARRRPRHYELSLEIPGVSYGASFELA